MNLGLGRHRPSASPVRAKLWVNTDTTEEITYMRATATAPVVDRARRAWSDDARRPAMAGSATSNAARTLARALVERGATRANPNLFELSSALEGRGIGRAFTKAGWRAHPTRYPETYWRLTRIKTRASGRSGEAYGVLTWKGRDRGVEEKINGSMKRVWDVVAEAAAAGERERERGPTLKAPPVVNANEEEEEGKSEG